MEKVGRSGTFDESRAERISDDIILCQELAKTNTTFFGNINHWILSPKAETQYKHMVKTCLNGRGHSLLKQERKMKKKKTKWYLWSKLTKGELANEYEKLKTKSTNYTTCFSESRKFSLFFY